MFLSKYPSKSDASGKYVYTVPHAPALGASGSLSEKEVFLASVEESLTTSAPRLCMAQHASS